MKKTTAIIAITPMNIQNASGIG